MKTVSVEDGLEAAQITFDKRGRSSEKCLVCSSRSGIRAKHYRLQRKGGKVRYRWGDIIAAEIIHTPKDLALSCLVVFIYASYYADENQNILERIRPWQR